MKGNVLIVEDELVIANFMKEFLEDNNYHVIGSLQSGEKAVHFVDNKRPDLIIMDIKLEDDVDGIEAARMIKSKYDIPVIYATGSSDSAHLERAALTNPDGYLVKPIDFYDLAAMVDNVMKRSIRTCAD